MPSKRKSDAVVRLVVAAATTLVAACAEIDVPQRPAITPLKMAPNTVVLDYMTVRFPQGDVAINDTLWTQVDEQRLPVELRRRLADNGFRAGVVGTRPPVELERLLKLDEKASPENAGGLKPVEATKPALTHNRHYLTSGASFQIITTGEVERHPEMAVLFRHEDGSVTGKTYSQVMGLFEIRATAEAANRVRLAVVPHLEHGQPKRHEDYSNGQVMFRFGPQHEIFSTLETSVSIAPGEMLVVGNLHNRPGSLGHHLLSEVDDGPMEQKLLLVRLTQTQYDGLFSADGLPSQAMRPNDQR